MAGAHLRTVAWDGVACTCTCSLITLKPKVARSVHITDWTCRLYSTPSVQVHALAHDRSGSCSRKPRARPGRNSRVSAIHLQIKFLHGQRIRPSDARRCCLMYLLNFRTIPARRNAKPGSHLAGIGHSADGCNRPGCTRKRLRPRYARLLSLRLQWPRPAYVA
jgi:hypothetical protein